LSDVENWTKICGTYTATGDEQFITIGFFRPDSMMNIVFFDTINATTYWPYYFIDDVWVYECEEEEINNVITIPNAFTPNGDGVNDVFSAEGHNIKSFNGIIINRWGQELYKWTDINHG